MRYDSTGEQTLGTRARTRLDKTRKKFDVWLDDEVLSLSDQDERISIVEIDEQPDYITTTTARGKYDGMILQKKGRKALRVTITLHLKAWTPEGYTQLINTVMTWAHSGKLHVNYRKNEYLEGQFTVFPDVDPQEWFSTVILEFTAMNYPYWRASKVVEVSGETESGKSTAVTITPVGDAPYCFLEGVFTNAGTQRCDHFTITAKTPTNGLGEQTESVFTFEALDHMPEEEFGIEYGEDDLLRLWRYTANISAIKCRTGLSSDDLVLTPGKPNEIVLQSDTPYRFTLRARGGFM